MLFLSQFMENLQDFNKNYIAKFQKLLNNMNSLLTEPLEMRQTFSKVKPEKKLLYMLPKHFISLKSLNEEYELYHDLYKNQKLAAKLITIKMSKYAQQIKIFQWRSKTQFPIIKTKIIQILKQTKENIYIKVYNEHCMIKLSSLFEINFHQILYIFKQSLIGFERLIDQFGAFQIKPNMVAINQLNKCKVWINENFFSNQKKSKKYTIKQLLTKILQMFEERCIRSQQSTQFFNYAKQINSFYLVLKFIDEYAKKNLIKIPNNFRMNLPNINKKTLSLKQSFKDMQKRKSRTISLITFMEKKNVQQNQEQEEDKCHRWTFKSNTSSLKCSSDTKDNSLKQKLGFSNNFICQEGQQKKQLISGQSLYLGSLNPKQFFQKNRSSIENTKLSFSKLIQTSQKIDEQKQEQSEIQNSVNESYDMIVSQKLIKNGWQPKISTILSCESPLTTSIQIGKQHNYYDQHKYQHFNIPKDSICESIIVDEQLNFGPQF